MDFRPMTPADAPAVKAMMHDFYTSPAVLSNGSDEIFDRDIAACVGDSPYMEGYVFLDGDAVVGYAMLAKSFATEFGKNCIWIEDLYLKEGCRGAGRASRFFSFLKTQFSGCVLRLEVERENTRAVAAYEKNGFSFLPYDEMILR